MLSFLKISDLAILDEVSLEPGPGLNVLTGETGAGKSIIVDAIGLVLGARGSADLIRTGADRLVVEALFDLADRPDAAAILEAAGLAGDGPADQVVIRRELLQQGGTLRSRAQVNGSLVTLSSLAALGEVLADLHGQHQHQSLLRADGQRDALDAFAGTLELRREVGALHAELRDRVREREALASRERERAREEDHLRRQIAEIDGVAPREAEDEALLREERLLRHATELSRLAGESFAMLSDDDDAVLSRLGAIDTRLAQLEAIDPEAGPVRALVQDARLAAAEAARSLAGYAGAEEADPQRLEQVATRLADLERLKRKYGATLNDVIAYADGCRRELSELGGAERRLEDLAERIASCRAKYLQSARALSERRRRAAARLDRAVEKEIGALAMQGAKVSVGVVRGDEADGGAQGLDSIEFLVAANPGEDPRPLARTASGGELSRLMLAVRVATESSSDYRTLVFDEVDSGIGGRVAEVVGQRLSTLGRRQQVLCVTHLPQIAAFADRHFQVTKRSEAGRTRAVVTRLDGKAKIDEVARMLGGAPAETARRHAEAMVKTAARRGRATT